VEARLRQLEGRTVNKAASLAKAAAAGAKGTPKAHDAARNGGTPKLLSAPKAYNADADVAAPSAKKEKKAKREREEDGDDDEAARKAAKKAAKKAKKEAERAAGGAGEDSD
jgi:hypothetical protein